jgi:phosphoenolpyruvate carboxykinase (GTP)
MSEATLGAKNTAHPPSFRLGRKDGGTLQYDKLYHLADSAMRGRTMYVVPYLMGPAGPELSKVGVELTDSVYVVLSMGVMARMGVLAYAELGKSDNFNRGLHCMLEVNPERRFIAHFPQDNTVISVGSN